MNASLDNSFTQSDKPSNLGVIITTSFLEMPLRRHQSLISSIDLILFIEAISIGSFAFLDSSETECPTFESNSSVGDKSDNSSTSKSYSLSEIIGFPNR